MDNAVTVIYQTSKKRMICSIFKMTSVLTIKYFDMPIMRPILYQIHYSWEDETFTL